MTVTPFEFRTSPAIAFGEGLAAELGARAGAILGSRVLVVTDPGIVRLGLGDAALSSFPASTVLTVHDEVGPDPTRAMVEAAAARAREIGATGILGLGGGSPLDVAKLAALLAGSDEPLDDAWGVGRARGPRLPLVLAPTTAGTGSEVTPVAIVTVGEGEKRGVSSPLLLPDLALLDPVLTYGLPPAVTAATGIDAMVHAIEAFTSASPNNNALSRSLARNALGLLAAHLADAVEGDRAARPPMLLGSMMAGQAFANSPVAAVHALAYPLGARFHVPHGLSNAVLLPHVLAYNAEEPAVARAYAELAPLLGARGSDGLIDRLGELIEEVGLDPHMRALGVGEDDLDAMADDAMLQTRLLVNNPREMTREAARAIYEAAL